MESYYSRLIVAASPCTPHPLTLFPYSDNYKLLTALELALLRAAGARPSHAAFLGCGPLPLSGLLIAEALGAQARVLNVDMDAAALAQGERFVLALDVTCHAGPDRMAFLRAEAGQLGGGVVAELDVVWLAALVGLDAETKLGVIGKVVEKMRVGAWLVVRSAAGLRRVLYPEVEVEAVMRVCGGKVRLVVEAHPGNEVINSVLVFQRVQPDFLTGTPLCYHADM